MGTVDIKWDFSMRYLGHTLCSGKVQQEIHTLMKKVPVFEEI